MLPDLEAIIGGTVIDVDKRHKFLNKYFNLCAEEYLFFDRGIIEKDVWRSWENGILWYLNHPTCSQFREFFDKEVKPYPVSYYNFPQSLKLQAVRN